MSFLPHGKRSKTRDRRSLFPLEKSGLSVFGWHHSETYAVEATALFSMDRGRARASRDPPVASGEIGAGRRRLLSHYKWLLPEATDSGICYLREGAMTRACEISSSFLSISTTGTLSESVRGIKSCPTAVDIERRKRRVNGDAVPAVSRS